MSKRERLEDLGRIFELVNNTLKLDLFEMYQGRNKDFLEYWDKMEEDSKETFLEQLPYRIDMVQDEIYKIWEIAKGDDDD